MKARHPSSADMRAFRWHLAPLERKLEASIDTARLACAVLQRKTAAMQHAIEMLAEQRRNELKSAGASRKGTFDPRAHARSLQYLVRLSGTIERKHAEVAELHLRIQAAGQDCMDAERQLACVVRMREAAQAAYAAGQFRIAAKESDLAWLTTRARHDRAAAELDGDGG